MDTYFAPAKRATDKELQKEIETCSNNPIINGLLNTVNGLLAVLNEQRQILAVNDSFIKLLGIKDLMDVLGLRPGEAIHCIHAHDPPAGCGTTKFCSTCGAAIAIVTSIAANEPAERLCAVTVEREGKEEEIFFRVNACPIPIEEQRFILLFLQDITDQQMYAALERSFLHDMSNLINGLVGISAVLEHQKRNSAPDLVKQITQLSLRLANEVAMQKVLSQAATGDYQPTSAQVSMEQILLEIRAVFIGHRVADGKLFNIPRTIPPITITTDPSLLIRILSNMVTNAFEATDEGGEVKLWIEQEDSTIAFCVWNRKTIPEDIAQRVFQRYFSTKDGPGRGIGTYSMKLFGEKYLHGKVDFTTNKSDGTIFRLTLPVDKDAGTAPAAGAPPTRILLVEDNQFDRDLARVVLEREGHRVIPTANGLEALVALVGMDFDLILMDMHMPEMDGCAATQCIRQCEQGIISDSLGQQGLLKRLSEKISGTHIPIVAMADSVESGDQDRYLEIGMDGYVSKPFQPEEVVAVLKRFADSLSR